MSNPAARSRKSSTRVSHVKRGRPPRAEADARRSARREELLRAAAKVFAGEGLRSVTMDQLAHRLGIAKIILYRFFDSKEDLVTSVLDRTITLLEELQSRPWRGLSVNLHEVMALARANPAEMRLLFRQCASDPEYRLYFDRLHRNIVRQTSDLLVSANSTLDDDPLVLKLCAEATAGLLIDVILWWLEEGDPARDPDFFAWARNSLAALYATWLSAEGPLASRRANDPERVPPLI